jgi:hypothetical protein
MPESKFENMTKGQKIEMWTSLESQKRKAPKTMTPTEVENYHYLKNNLWYEI